MRGWEAAVILFGKGRCPSVCHSRTERQHRVDTVNTHHINDLIEKVSADSSIALSDIQHTVSGFQSR